MKTVCLDFDGVIHQYNSRWISAATIEDAPVTGAFDFIQECLDSGFQIVINSTRCKTPEGREAMRRWFSDYGCKNLKYLAFLDYKPPAVIYIDDRGFRFEGTFPSMDYIKHFTPWNKT